MKRLTFFLSLMLTSQWAAAQNLSLDSLSAVISALPDDTSKIRQLHDLAERYSDFDLQKSFRANQEAYALARKLGAKPWLPRIEMSIGRKYANTSQPDSALQWFQQAQKGFEANGDRKNLASLFSKFRYVHSFLGEYEKALEYSYKALSICEELKDEPGVAMAYSYISEVLFSQKKYQESAGYAQKAYDTQKRLGLKDDLAYTCVNLGDTWLQLGDLDKAYSFQNEGLQLRRELKDDFGIGVALNGRGNALKYLKRYAEALADYKEGLEIGRRIGFTNLISACISNIGHINNLMKNYRQALPYHLEMNRMLRASGEKMNLPENYLLLSEAYAGVGKFDSAYHFANLRTELKDSLLTEETSARMSELQTKYETAQREAKISLQDVKLKEQRTAIWAIAAVLAVALTAGVLLWRLARQLRKRNEEKEFLIKEIHHRVKNNLQVLSSLLHLQSRHIEDETALDAVRESQNRVHAMSLIHQKLYMGDNLSAVEMGSYLQQLGDTLLDSFGLEDRVQIICHVPSLRLDVDAAIPLGLIVNELVTNSLKYAFPGGRHGRVEISLLKNDSGQLCLQVGDDGVGKAEAPQLKNSTSFGANLVDILSKKLKGTPEVSHEKGYATSILFENFKEAVAP